MSHSIQLASMISGRFDVVLSDRFRVVPPWPQGNRWLLEVPEELALQPSLRELRRGLFSLLRTVPHTHFPGSDLPDKNLPTPEDFISKLDPFRCVVIVRRGTYQVYLGICHPGADWFDFVGKSYLSLSWGYLVDGKMWFSHSNYRTALRLAEDLAANCDAVLNPEVQFETTQRTRGVGYMLAQLGFGHSAIVDQIRSIRNWPYLIATGMIPDWTGAMDLDDQAAVDKAGMRYRLLRALRVDEQLIYQGTKRKRLGVVRGLPGQPTLWSVDNEWALESDQVRCCGHTRQIAISRWRKEMQAYNRAVLAAKRAQWLANTRASDGGLIGWRTWEIEYIGGKHRLVSPLHSGIWDGPILTSTDWSEGDHAVMCKPRNPRGRVAIGRVRGYGPSLVGLFPIHNVLADLPIQSPDTWGWVAETQKVEKLWISPEMEYIADDLKELYKCRVIVAESKERLC